MHIQELNNFCEFHSLYFLCNNVCLINSRRMRWNSSCRMYGGNEENLLKRPIGRQKVAWVDNVKMEL
jgi:hypothetical protein